MNKKVLHSLFWLGLLLILVHFGLNHLYFIPKVISFVISLFLPFLVGGAFAFIVNAPANKFELLFEEVITDKNKRRLVAVLLSLFLVFSFVAFLLILVLPSFIDALVDVAYRIPNVIGNVSDFLTNTFKSYPGLESQIQSLSQESTKWVQEILNLTSTSVGIIVNWLTQIFSSAISALFTFVVSFAFAIYLLLGRDKLKKQGKMLLYAFVPENIADRIVDLVVLSHHVFSGFLMGQVCEGFINGTICFILCLIFNFPFKVVVAVVIGVGALIPYFGMFIGSAIGCLLICSVSPYSALIFLILMIVVIQIDGNLIYPRIVGNQIGLPGIWVMVAVYVGASLMGFAGMIIMVPVASIIYAILALFTKHRLFVKKINVDELEVRDVYNIFPDHQKPEEVNDEV